jgi:hypothetical protein
MNAFVIKGGLQEFDRMSRELLDRHPEAASIGAVMVLIRSVTDTFEHYEARVTELETKLAAAEARVAGLEAANAVRSGLEKVSIVRLTRTAGGGA